MILIRSLTAGKACMQSLTVLEMCTNGRTKASCKNYIGGKTNFQDQQKVG